jgi:hypothetical protein
MKVECGGKAIRSALSFKAGMVVVSLRRPVMVEAGQTLVARMG